MEEALFVPAVLKGQRRRETARRGDRSRSRRAAPRGFHPTQKLAACCYFTVSGGGREGRVGLCFRRPGQCFAKHSFILGVSRLTSATTCSCHSDFLLVLFHRHQSFYLCRLSAAHRNNNRTDLSEPVQRVHALLLLPDAL